MSRAKMPAGTPRASSGEPETFDISDLMREVGEDADPEGKRVSLAEMTAMNFEGRRAALKRAVSNLVGNGLKYANRVWLDARRTGPYVELLIDDDGPGIPNDKRREVFKPFYRLDEARTGNQIGVGLGLSVVREVARSHGGDISLDRSPHGGLRATLRLPG